MSKEKKAVELKEEELEKVAGGTPPSPPPITQQIIQSKNLYCPDCNFYFGDYINVNEVIERTTKYCPTCNKQVEPIVIID